MTYHGSKRSSLANEVLAADVVITTYETVRTEWADQSGARPLQCVKWLRIVLDEGKYHPLRVLALDSYFHSSSYPKPLETILSLGLGSTGTISMVLDRNSSP